MSQGNKGSEHGWKKLQGTHQAGRVRAVRGPKNLQGDEGAGGWNMTTSELRAS